MCWVYHTHAINQSCHLKGVQHVPQEAIGGNTKEGELIVLDDGGLPFFSFDIVTQVTCPYCPISHKFCEAQILR